MIGGAQLWVDLLNANSDLAVVDKLLVTRILTPKYDCDVHFPEFRTREQFNTELEHAKKIAASQNVAGVPETTSEEQAKLLPQQQWTQASVETLREYLGSSCPAALKESADMVTNEGETWYEYQLWEKTG